MKVGIVYYSRTGNTKKAAEILKNKIENDENNVELIEIEHQKKPGFFKAGRAAMTQKELPIKNTDFDLEKYDAILVGSPTWAGKPAPYLKTFFKKAENYKDKKAGVFITGSASGEKNEKTSDFLKEYLSSVGLKTFNETLNLKMKKEEVKDKENKIDDFLENIK